MKKQWIRFWSVMLAVCLLSTVVLAVDGENVIMPRYTYVSDVTMGFDIAGDGKAYCSTGVTLHGLTYTCSLEMTLQRYEDGEWSDVKTWSTTGDSNADIEKFWYVASGYEYRTSNVVRVYNTNGRLVETVTVESHTVDYNSN